MTDVSLSLPPCVGWSQDLGRWPGNSRPSSGAGLVEQTRGQISLDCWHLSAQRAQQPLSCTDWGVRRPGPTRLGCCPHNAEWARLPLGCGDTEEQQVPEEAPVSIQSAPKPLNSARASGRRNLWAK